MSKLIAKSVPRPVESAEFWREDFLLYVKAMQVPYAVNNPIVEVRPAYPDTQIGNHTTSGWKVGAEVQLKDGTIYRFDRYHGGGFWHIKRLGSLPTSSISIHLAIVRIRDSRHEGDKAVAAAEGLDEEQTLKHWVASDQYLHEGAVYAIAYLLAACNVHDLLEQES